MSWLRRHGMTVRGEDVVIGAGVQMFTLHLYSGNGKSVGSGLRVLSLKTCT